MMHWIDILRDFVVANRDWAWAPTLVLAAVESIAFLGLLVPGSVFLFLIAALVVDGTLPFWPVAIGIVVGAIIGDGLSYWIGRAFADRIPGWWPFRSRPEWLARGEAFFRRWGVLAVFACRYFGPLRASVPIAAGMLAMPTTSFMVANVLSAIVWVPGLLFSGVILDYAWNLIMKLVG